MRGKWWSACLLLVAGAGLFGGLAWLIHLRFETGQAYPVRSSMRTDPMGAKALFEAYDYLDSVTAVRNFTPLDQLKQIEPNATLLLLNHSGGRLFGLSRYDVLTDFVENGGRLVVALNPDWVAYEYLRDELVEDDEASSEEAGSEKTEPVPFTRKDSDDSVFWAKLSLQHGEHSGGRATRVDGLGETVPWREGGIVSDYDADIWQPVFVIGEEVVAVQRDLGQGSIVVMTDDYLFSNEALLQHRYTDFLAWIVLHQERVIFEETHLGVAEQGGIAVLMRRYRLHAFFVTFAGFMALVVWRGASPLLPPFSAHRRENVVMAEHSVEAGLGDLVRRSLPLSEQPEAAFQQWKRSCVRSGADQRYYAQELQEVEQVLQTYRNASSRHRNSRETHLQIKSIINRKKRKRL